MKKTVKQLEYLLKNSKKCRTLKDLESSPLVEVWQESSMDTKNGVTYWGSCIEGLQAYGNYQGSIHEDTIKDFCDVANTLEIWIEE